MKITKPELTEATAKVNVEAGVIPPTDKQLLRTAKNCRDEKLQIAFDRMLLCKAEPGTKEYGKRWQNYLRAHGSLDMLPKGIDTENYKNYLAV